LRIASHPAFEIATGQFFFLPRAVIDEPGLSTPDCSRILKIARTIANLEGAEDIAAHHISEAIQNRSLDRTLL
jgi:magnesium chelatase family protein